MFNVFGQKCHESRNDVDFEAKGDRDYHKNFVHKYVFDRFGKSFSK